VSGSPPRLAGNEKHIEVIIVVGDTTEVVELRTVPIQQRSNQRMQNLLDAAANIIAAEGIDAVTTTSVAYKSSSSVGVIYRYFPNIDSLLRALAHRNLQRYLARVEEGSDKSPAVPWSSWDLTLDSFVEMCRNEPSFRQLGFGDIINDRFLDNEVSNNTVVAKAFAGIVSETHGVPVTEDMLFHIETAVWMGSALLDRAFQADPIGDDRFIEEARRVIGDYLRTNIPITPK
jgi:AcrR family transcriptional regulator